MSTKELVPAMYRWRGPKGGWIADDEKPSWPSEPLYSADTIERLERERDEAGAQIVSAREECPLVRRQDYFGTASRHLLSPLASRLRAGFPSA